MMTQGTDEVEELRRGLRNLAALTALPLLWSNSQPADIADGLSDVLLTTLRLDFVYICFESAGKGERTELYRTTQELHRGSAARAIGRHLEPWLKPAASIDVHTIPHPIQQGHLDVAVCPVGHYGAYGIIVAAMPAPYDFGELDRLLLNTAANQVVPALQQAQLRDDLRQANEVNDALVSSAEEARKQAEKAQQRMRFLAEANALLSSSLNYETTLENISSLAVPAIADWCSIIILNENGDVETLKTSARSPEILNVLNEIARQYPFNLTRSFAATEVIRTGKSLLLKHVDEDLLRAYSENSDYTKHLRKLKPGSAIIVPIVARDTVYGTMALNITESDRHYDEEDLALVEDIGRRAAIAIEQARLHRAEIEARRLAEDADATKLRFLAMISHELRTPLTSIKGFASTLLGNDVQFNRQEQREFLHIIDEEADKLTELVDQLLDLSRLQAGTMRITPEDVPLETILDLARPQLRLLSRQHRLVLKAQEPLPWVNADPQRIVQVLSNLVHNAAKYSPPETQITIAITVHDEQVQIDVCDEGIGIPPESREHLFAAFRQVERKLDTQKGAGLGLAICKALVEAHGGHIWISEQPDPGTTISFTLPIVNPAA